MEAKSGPGLVMMFHIGRSGSRVLGDLLNQHSVLHWDHEAFVAQLQAARRQGAAKPEGDPMALIRERWALVSRNLWFGTEVKFFHLRLFGHSLANFVNQSVALGFDHFVQLKRQNYLRKIVSSLVAQQTNCWHQRQDTTTSLTPIQLNVDRVAIDWVERRLLDHLHQFEANFTEVAAVLQPYPTLNLTYEADILPDPAIGYAKVCRFLGLPEEKVTVRYGRSNPYPLRQLIQNFDEVAQTLKNSPYEWMLWDEKI